MSDRNPGTYFDIFDEFELDHAEKLNLPHYADMKVVDVLTKHSMRKRWYNCFHIIPYVDESRILTYSNPLC